MFEFLKPYLTYAKVVGVIGIFLAGMWLMRTIDTASHAKLLEAQQEAQNLAVAAAVKQAQRDAQIEQKAAVDLAKQQEEALQNKLRLAQDLAKNKAAYSCKLDPEGYAALQEAFK